MLLGTLGYMSPEQVRGLPADHRADIFAFGVVLYEMLTGRRAFSGQTSADTLAAILHREPPEIAGTDGDVPPGVQRILKRCLEKNPAERFQSAQDLAFGLEALSWSAAAGAPPDPGAARAFRNRRAAILALAGLAVASLGFEYSRRRFGASAAGAAAQHLSFQQLTFRPGHIHRARFGRDGETIFYSAGFGGNEDDVFFTRPGNAEGRALGFSDVNLLSVSAQGELAIQLRSGDFDQRTLARMTFPGGAPREVASAAADADWTPDGQGLALVKYSTLEFPPGKTLFKSNGALARPRFSPSGDRLAFFESSTASGGTIWSMDLAGNKTRLVSGFMDSADGFAWSPRGDELWFVSRPESGDGSVLRAVDAAGRIREIRSFDGYVSLEDVAPNGDVLVQRVLFQQGLAVIDRGGKPRDLTWLGRSMIVDVSDDLKFVLFTETVGESPFVYLRRTDSNEAVRLGEGTAKGLSPDGNWALAIAKQAFVLYPVGAGEARALSLSSMKPAPSDFHWASWFPDGKRILFSANFPEAGRGFATSRLFAIAVDTGEIEPMSPADQYVGYSLTHSISPDGRFVLATTDDGYGVSSLEGKGFRDVGILGARPIRWSKDGQHVFYIKPDDQRLLYRLEVATGRTELWKELTLTDPVTSVNWVVMTSDGRGVAYSYQRTLANLYLVKGLR